MRIRQKHSVPPRGLGARSATLLAMSSLVAFGCKGEEVRANVNCKVTPIATVKCIVEQSKGTSEVEVCWDFSVACASGATLKAERTCTKVKDGSTESVTVPKENITIEGTCEGDLTAELVNLTLNGKASKK